LGWRGDRPLFDDEWLGLIDSFRSYLAAWSLLGDFFNLKRVFKFLSVTQLSLSQILEVILAGGYFRRLSLLLRSLGTLLGNLTFRSSTLRIFI